MPTGEVGRDREQIGISPPFGKGHRAVDCAAEAIAPAVID